MKKAPAKPIPLTLTTKKDLPTWLTEAGPKIRRWCEDTGFTAEPGQVALLPGANGQLAGAVVGLENNAPALWSLAGLPTALPPHAYRLTGRYGKEQATALALGWALGAYRFTRYTRGKKPLATLVPPATADQTQVRRLTEAVTTVRDLINTPANDLGTEELAKAGQALARRHGATVKLIKGEALLKANYPAIHAVGRASPRPPLLLDIRWGKPGHKKLTLVGKGVVFDTGGLNIKTGNYMLLMKKDMGGAAHALALAGLIMSEKLPVRLRVLIPVAENSVAGNAFRPGDVIPTRSGQTVEIGNTDAEGRLILCDALTEAASEKPDLIVDFATLTGAAWSAVGPHLGVYFSTDKELADQLDLAAESEVDPLWRFPLWQPYVKTIRGKISDLSNTGAMGTAGAITAALYLQQFVPAGQKWMHFDVRGWNEASRPGRPEGGEAMGLRAMFAVLRQRYKTKG